MATSIEPDGTSRPDEPTDVDDSKGRTSDERIAGADDYVAPDGSTIIGQALPPSPGVDAVQRDETT